MVFYVTNAFKHKSLNARCLVEDEKENNNILTYAEYTKLAAIQRRTVLLFYYQYSDTYMHLKRCLRLLSVFFSFQKYSAVFTSEKKIMFIVQSFQRTNV